MASVEDLDRLYSMLQSMNDTINEKDALIEDIRTSLDIVWVLVAAILVFSEFLALLSLEIFLLFVYFNSDAIWICIARSGSSENKKYSEYSHEGIFYSIRIKGPILLFLVALESIGRLYRYNFILAHWFWIRIRRKGWRKWLHRK
jgi:hypothetical protein